jgi:hypothetical protein
VLECSMQADSPFGKAIEVALGQAGVQGGMFVLYLCMCVCGGGGGGGVEGTVSCLERSRHPSLLVLLHRVPASPHFLH